jgi:hypothetical protein
MAHAHRILDTRGYKTHSEYVTIIDLTLQQYLRESALLLG